MHITKRLLSYFSKADIALWLSSVFMICLSFILFDNHSGMTLIASLLGVTSILLNAKGNPVGQLLMIIFSLLYGIISYSFSYYGEMITYLGMTMPMALLALISWLRHPYKGRKSEVEVNRIVMRETFFHARSFHRGYRDLLLHIRQVSHRQHLSEHSFRYDQFYRRLPYLQAQSVLFCCICSE